MNPSVNIIAQYIPPKFCVKCATPFPWTASRTQALVELIDFEKKLAEKDKEMMKKNLDDIIYETPRTQIAAMKFKQGLAQSGKETAKAIRDILIVIASETAKSYLIGNT